MEGRTKESPAGLEQHEVESVVTVFHFWVNLDDKLRYKPCPSQLNSFKVVQPLVVCLCLAGNGSLLQC